MIQKVHAPPLAFEKTVREAVGDALAGFDFVFEEPFPLYANEITPFVRHRSGVREEIWIQRRIHYDDDEVSKSDGDDELDAIARGVSTPYRPPDAA
jgi:hypothetical protein